MAINKIEMTMLVLGIIIVFELVCILFSKMEHWLIGEYSAGQKWLVRYKFFLSCVTALITVFSSNIKYQLSNSPS